MRDFGRRCAGYGVRHPGPDDRRTTDIHRRSGRHRPALPERKL